MRYIELVPGIKSSVLGFGCAPILGSVGPAVARRALAVALEEGVTHFDIARSYGFGDAEGLVGEFMSGRRDRVVLATKFGIAATPLARVLQPLKPAIRALRALKGAGKGGTGAPAAGMGGRFLQRLPLNAATMRTSLEKSLRALRTDYVDYLFIHEPLESITELDGLAEEAARLKATGKLRAWGVAYMRETSSLLGASFDRFDVLQCDLAPGADGYDAFRLAHSEEANLFFSPFRGAPANMPRSEVLGVLTRDFPRSVVLCSMFSEKHIRANARSF
jgi:aryl-alcohol dehydrogenase-like predicted oxidoreductase